MFTVPSRLTHDVNRICSVPVSSVWEETQGDTEKKESKMILRIATQRYTTTRPLFVVAFSPQLPILCMCVYVCFLEPATVFSHWFRLSWVHMDLLSLCLPEDERGRGEEGKEREGNSYVRLSRNATLTSDLAARDVKEKMKKKFYMNQWLTLLFRPWSRQGGSLSSTSVGSDVHLICRLLQKITTGCFQVKFKRDKYFWISLMICEAHSILNTVWKQRDGRLF